MEALSTQPLAGRLAMNILVIEDDPVIRKSVVQGLTEGGHECTGCRDGEKGLETACQQTPDLIVLDLMLPGLPGLEVLRLLRKRGIQSPVIVLTALGGIDDRVVGLQTGADDYLVKPFAFPELMARVEAVSRRVMNRPPSTLQVDDLTLDLGTRRVKHGETEVELTPTEFSVLELLMRFAGQVVTRKTLCERVWGFSWEGNTNVIEVHINRLRRKLDFAGDDSLIRTVRGRGYAIRTT